jgi:serine/threonine-protein kinase
MARQLGRYELLRPIAKGGMATVYLARVSGEGGFERLVALKLMHPHIADDQEFVSMFLDEARLAARIRHPNVVSTIDVDRSGDALFLVMDLVEGHALHTIIRHLALQRQSMPMEVALRIIIDLLEGLHAAHELKDSEGNSLNLVHRDVSPQNVLVGDNGVSRITDFGVAHASSRLSTTRGGGIKGKIAYLSPEQVTGMGVDRRSDVFAAGIVLWELLTTRRLFRGDNEGQTVAMLLAGPKKPPQEVVASIPTAVGDACMKALAKEPELRFPTAIAMADALERAAQTAGIGVANQRRVAAYIAELGLPRPTTEALADAKDGAPASVPAPSFSKTGSVPLVASARPAAPRGRRWVLGVVLLLAGVGAAAAFLLRSPAGPAAEASTQPAVQEPAPAAATVASLAPSAAEAGAAPAASAPPAASSGSAPDQQKPEEPEPSHVNARPAERPAEAKRPKPSATSYRPDEL